MTKTHLMTAATLGLMTFTLAGCQADGGGDAAEVRQERDRLLMALEQEQQARGEQQSRISVLEADMERLQAELAAARRELGEAEALSATNDQAVARLNQAQARVRQAEQRAEAAERRLAEMDRPVGRLGQPAAGGNKDGLTPDMNKDGGMTVGTPEVNEMNKDAGPSTRPATRPMDFNK